MLTARRLSCSIHGLALRMRCALPALDEAIEHLLQPFIVSEWPEGFIPVDGAIQPYESADVMRHLPASARRYSSADASMEIYVDDQQFWLVDDRWGMAEIDLRANSWRSWVLPTPSITAHEVAELAVLWPAAQLVRNRGLYLAPAISLCRGDWGILLVCPNGMEPELSAMVQTGYQVVGQRWTAMREDDGGVALLHVPGHLERGTTRRVRPLTPKPIAKMGVSLTDSANWIDLVADAPAAAKNHAFCRAVVLVEGARRPDGWVRPVSSINTLPTLRRHWPMVELEPAHRIATHMLTRLAETCPVFEMRLSRDPAEAVRHIDAIRTLGAPQITAERERQRVLWEATPPLNLTPWSLAG